MKQLNKIPLFLFILFIFVFPLQASDACSGSDFTTTLTSSTTSYTNTDTVYHSNIIKQDHDSYYIQVQESGYVTISISSESNHATMQYSETGCPSESGGVSTNIIQSFPVSSDFNLMINSTERKAAAYTLTIIFTPNKFPLANDKGYTTPYNTPKSGNFVSATDANGSLVTGLADSDADGDTIVVTSNTNPSNGTVVVSADGSFIYTPNNLFVGDDSFTYTIDDGNYGTATATVTITVLPKVNYPPTANDKIFTTAYNTALNRNAISDTSGGNVADSDPNTGDTLVIDSFTNPSQGVVTMDIGGDGTFTYTPNAGASGNDSFTYTIKDDGDATSTATITITIEDEIIGNNPPVANNKNYTTDEDTAVSGNIITDAPANTDPDGDTMTINSFTSPNNGTLTIISLGGDGSFTYTPNTGYTGSDTFTYTTTDGKGGISQIATVTIVVNESTVVAPPIQNEYTCGLFPSVLTTYEHITSGGNNDEACFTTNIAYPDGEITGDIVCSPDCEVAGTSCDRIDPPTNRYDHDFPTNSKSGIDEDSNPVELTKLEYGIMNYAGGTVHLNPQTTYADNDTKVMLLGDTYIDGSTLNFEPGDYYFDSLTIAGNNNEMILPNGGLVNIYIKGDFTIKLNNTNINSTGDEDNLFIYIAGKLLDNSSGGGSSEPLKAYIYVEGTVTLNNNSTNWEIYGGITAEGAVFINGNNPTFIQSGDGSGAGVGECSLCYGEPHGSDGLSMMMMDMCTPMTPCDLYVPIRNTSPVALDNVEVIEAQKQTFFTFSWGNNYSVLDKEGNVVPGTSAEQTSDTHVDLPLGFDIDLKNGDIKYHVGDSYPTYYPDEEYYEMHKTTTMSMSFGSTGDTVYLAKYTDDNDRNYYIQLDMCEEPVDLPVGFETGPFEAWDIFRGDTTGDGNLNDFNISTKIAAKNFELTIGSLNADKTQTEVKVMGGESTLHTSLYDEGDRMIGTTNKHDINTLESINQLYSDVKQVSKQVNLGYMFCSLLEKEDAKDPKSQIMYMLRPDSECKTNDYQTDPVPCKEETHGNPKWRLCYASDAFSIRPDRFLLTPPNGEDLEMLTSGVQYDFKLEAVDDLDVITTDYDQNGTRIDYNLTLRFNNGEIDTTNDLQGIATIQTDQFDFKEGVSKNSQDEEESVEISFDNVAKIDLQLRDKYWAAIDNDDTPQTCDDPTSYTLPSGTTVNIPGTYICSNTNQMRYIPASFSVIAEMSNNRTPDTTSERPFTYLTYNDDLNMSVRMKASITALNANGNTVTNFRGGNDGLHYENDINVSIINIPTIDDTNAEIKDADNLDLVTIKKPKVSTPAYFNFTNGVYDITWASKYLMFNYNKKLDKAINPFRIKNVTASEIALGVSQGITIDSGGRNTLLRVSSIYTKSDGTITPNSTISTDANVTGEALFYYGRVKSSRYYYKDIKSSSIATPISINVYCLGTSLLCQDNFGINIADGITDERNWYISDQHDSSLGDGEVALKLYSPLIEGSGSPSVTPEHPTKVQAVDGIANNVIVSNTDGIVTPTLPLTVGIDLVYNYTDATGTYSTTTDTDDLTDLWLLHNPGGTTPPQPFYKVRFVTEADWTGQGETGSTVNIDATYQDSKRMNW